MNATYLPSLETSETSSAPRPANPWPALLVVCLGFFMIMLDTTIVLVATPSMLTSLGASFDAILWVINRYLLSYAVLLITAGRLGDIYGPRTLFALGLVVFTASSAACGLAQNTWQLVGARVVQGVGGAMLAPQSLAMLTLMFRRERMGAALGVWGAVVGISIVAGPTLGGLIITYWDWRWIFFINVPVGVIALLGTFTLVPDARSGRHHRLDLIGAVLSALALLAITYGLIEGQRYEWGTITGMVSIPLVLAAGLVLVGVFLAYESRQAEPLAPLHLFASRNFSLMNLASAAVMFGTTCIFLPITIYMQSVIGMSALQAGLTLAPMSLTSMVVAPLSGRLVDRLGGKYLLMAGFAIFAAGAYWIASVAALDTTWATFAPAFVAAGLGMGLTFPPLTTLAMREVSDREAGAASGILNTMRQLGNLIGSAVVGAVLQAQLAITLHNEAVTRAAALPAAIRTSFIDAFAQAVAGGLQVGAGQSGAQFPAGTPEQVAALAREVFAYGFLDALRPTMSVGVIALVLASVGCFLIVQRRRAARTEPADGHE